MTENYLIIGGEGFLGRWIVDFLLKRGDKNISTFDKEQRYFDQEVIHYVGDICNYQDVNNAISKTNVTTVFHTASPPHDGIPNEVYWKVNVEGTKNVIDSCIANGVKKLIFTSSSSVIYDGKEGEKLVKSANGKNGLLTVCLRPCGIFGPNDRQLIPGAITVMEYGQSKFQVGDNFNLVDFTYVENAAHAHLLASDKLTADRFIFASLSEFACYFSGKKSGFTRFRVKLTTNNRYFDITKARRLLGYEPIVDLEEANGKNLNHIMSHNNVCQVFSSDCDTIESSKLKYSFNSSSLGCGSVTVNTFSKMKLFCFNVITGCGSVTVTTLRNLGLCDLVGLHCRDDRNNAALAIYVTNDTGNAVKSDAYLNINDLEWSKVKVPDSVFMGDQDELAGFLCLEEIDNVDIVDIEREEVSTKGHTIRFEKVQKVQNEKVMFKKNNKKNVNESLDNGDSEEYEDIDSNLDIDVDVSAWNKFNLSLEIMKGLKSLKFNKPTPIQEEALPAGLSGRDVVGAAETGSGKTLAFVGLILTPTRELAIQIRDHLMNICKFTKVKIMSIVGGMAIQKQKRLLAKQPNIIIGTPGRFWEVFSENHDYIQTLRHIKYLVLDEADRMLETGHFKELDNILTILSRNWQQNTSEWNDDGEIVINETKATLDSNLNENLKHKWRNNSRKKDQKSKGTMAELMQRLEFYDPDPIFIDITPKDSVAETLQESKIDCLVKDKDLYVYYFITRYPGRTIIFVNSIDSIRRLVPILNLLNVDALGLHAQMQQRQRLKNLDRFKQDPKAVMVASDVAARGLDIPLIDHVIHYQLPHLPKTEKRIPDFPIEAGIINAMKQRTNLAKQIDQEQHKLQKNIHDDSWMKKAAEEFGIELDEDLQLLSQPLVPRGISTKYLTSGIVRDLADRLLDESSHNNQIMGVKRTKATDDFKSRKSSKKKRKISS
ncbi:4303_t:CDS:10 [Diversispora eburnea]|uniref:ATP-dependent RNA helicase n=1 Tax=Diversispora eburnea TaxID=1213867 RepID=A0A9N8VVI4_9GLOM|nr:4303_t:CDS:10 [Diversispora eburnea]